MKTLYTRTTYILHIYLQSEIPCSGIESPDKLYHQTPRNIEGKKINLKKKYWKKSWFFCGIEKKKIMMLKKIFVPVIFPPQLQRFRRFASRARWSVFSTSCNTFSRFDRFWFSRRSWTCSCRLSAFSICWVKKILHKF